MTPQPRAAVTRAEHQALADVVSALSDQIEADRAMRKDTHAMVLSLHRALIEPAPGHEHGLLHRMAAVTIAAETGQAAGERVVWWAKVVAAAGTIGTAMWAVLTFGHNTGGPR